MKAVFPMAQLQIHSAVLFFETREESPQVRHRPSRLSPWSRVGTIALLSADQMASFQNRGYGAAHQKKPESRRTRGQGSPLESLGSRILDRLFIFLRISWRLPYCLGLSWGPTLLPISLFCAENLYSMLNPGFWKQLAHFHTCGDGEAPYHESNPRAFNWYWWSIRHPTYVLSQRGLGRSEKTDRLNLYVFM